MLGLGRSVDPRLFVTILLCFIISITIHEFAHAWTANQLGDDTARLAGRITLNPIAHFDPIGFLFLVLIALGGGFLGWGRPVPINSYRLRGGKHGMAVVAAAGPISNLIIAAVLAVPIRLLPGTFESLPLALQLFLSTMVRLNIGLFAFNLIPLPPLDGLKILTGLLPDFWLPVLAPLDRYGFVILFIVIFFLPQLIFGISGPVQDVVTRLIIGTPSAAALLLTLFQ